MVSERALLVINISLGIVVVLLVLLLAGLKLPTLGQAQYALDKEEPLCWIDWDGSLTPFENIDRCCLQAREQDQCQAEHMEKTDWVCGAEQGLRIRFNNKAYYYCQQQPYW